MWAEGESLVEGAGRGVEDTMVPNPISLCLRGTPLANFGSPIPDLLLLLCTEWEGESPAHPPTYLPHAHVTHFGSLRYVLVPASFPYCCSCVDYHLPDLLRALGTPPPAPLQGDCNERTAKKMPGGKGQPANGPRPSSLTSSLFL